MAVAWKKETQTRGIPQYHRVGLFRHIGNLSIPFAIPIYILKK